MGTPNTTVALLLAATGGVLVWTGITNPEGGISGALGSVLRGEPVKTTAPTSSGGPARYAESLWSGRGTAAGVNAAASAAVGTGSADAVVSLARAQIGIPYAWGEESPGEGFDCSGLVVYVYGQAAGLKMPRTAAQQALTGTNVPLSSLAPGDLVFWGAPAHHVGIAASGSTVIHAPKRGDKVKEAPIWSTKTAYARRVLGGAAKTRTLVA